MNVILFSENDIVQEGQIKISGRRQEHIVSILKAKIGDELKVGMINGDLGVGKITEISEEGVTLNVCLKEKPLSKIPLTVIVALSRPPVFRRVISAVTSFGVEKIICCQTARVEKSYWSSPALNEDSVRELMLLGLEQSGDTVLPEIIFEKRFKPFVEDRLPEISQGKQCFVAHPDHAMVCPSNITEPCVLAIGPEGGFVDYEVKKLKDVGFQTVYFGGRILRVETAVSAFIGRLMPINNKGDGHFYIRI